MADKKRPPGRDRDDVKYQLAQAHLQRANQSLDDEEEIRTSIETGTIILRVAIGIGLVLWIVAMIWLAKSALRKKENAEHHKVAIEVVA